MTSTIPDITDEAFNKLADLFGRLRAKQHEAVTATEHPLPTVAIIGAGISGIAAAKALASRGCLVHIIEARERIGGRIHTKCLENGAYIEFGAQFLHGIKQNPLMSVFEKYGIELQSIGRDYCSVFDDQGHAIHLDDLIPLMKANQDKILSLAQKRQQDSQDRFKALALKDIVNQLKASGSDFDDKLSRAAHELSLSELEEVSLFAYKLGLGKKISEQNYLITNGFVHLLEKMLGDVEDQSLIQLHLGCPVQKVEHHSNKVSVTLQKGSLIEADAVICTLPLGVLQQGTVLFDPPLPEAKRESINRLKMTNHNKVILEFEDAFWDNASHYVIPYDKEKRHWLDIINLHHFNEEKAALLVASIYGDSQQPQKSDSEEIEAVLSLLKKIFHGKMKPLKHAYVTHWDVDPYAFGSYCYHPENSSLDDNTEIARPIGRLCFAGEHTQRNPSNIFGAYISGFESAIQVVAQLTQILKLAKI